MFYAKYYDIMVYVNICKIRYDNQIYLEKRVYDLYLEIPPLSDKTTIFFSFSDLKIHCSLLSYKVMYFGRNIPEKLIKMAKIGHFPTFRNFEPKYFFSHSETQKTYHSLFSSETIVFDEINPKISLKLANISKFGNSRTKIIFFPHTAIRLS